MACPFPSLCHLQGLPNNAAYAVGVTQSTPESHAWPGAWALSSKHKLFCSQAQNIPPVVLPHPLLLHCELCRFVRSWSCSRETESVQTTPQPCDVRALARGLLGAWACMERVSGYCQDRQAGSGGRITSGSPRVSDSAAWAAQSQQTAGWRMQKLVVWVSQF